MKNTTARATVSTPSRSIAEAAGQIAGAFFRENELSSVSIVSALLCVACLSGCDRTPREAPPRAPDTLSGVSYTQIPDHETERTIAYDVL